MTPEEQDRQVKSSVAEQVRYINEALKRAEAGSEEWQRWLLKHGDIAVSQDGGWAELSVATAHADQPDRGDDGGAVDADQ